MNIPVVLVDKQEVLDKKANMAINLYIALII